ncbi:MAG TPA: hypothetical protein VGG06_33530 [Thermoanaerobaculia bacterium]|jgi:hypothetical protein
MIEVLDASPPRSVRVHLTTFRELERHVRDERKHAGYERLLADFGVDARRFSRLARHPRLILAEQPGCWFGGDDLMRYRLLARLAEVMGTGAPEVLSLASDAFTCRGGKRDFLLFKLHRRLGSVHLVGASYLRRHRNRVYDALTISGAARERLAALLDTTLAMLGSAAVSPAAFADAVLAIFRAGVRPGARALLPARCDRRGLRSFAARLRRYDLEAARRPLAAAREALAEGVSWVGYWDRVNAVFLGTEIGALGPLFNRFLLAVDDPVKMARQLIRLCRPAGDEPIAVAAVVAGGAKYRMVFFDPADERFFYRPRPRRRRPISWDRLRELARGGRTGGPAGTLEYLLMAASGIYLVADPVDGHSRFERDARRIHELYTGLSFPYVALPASLCAGEPDYLEMFAPGFAEQGRAACERFFS